jgi:gliding motility-associated-like protein
MQNNKRYFLLLFFSVILTFHYLFLNAQVPLKVFEISDILVDGCAGGDEGRNEMVRFRIGSNPVHVNDLRVDGAGANNIIIYDRWPNTNNAWRGIAAPPAKPAEIAQINATILNCGFLIEPPGGILPAGKDVLMITSTEFSPMAHSFETLQDTLYVIFQNAGNTSGHFVNYGTPSSFRTLVFMHVPTAVGDTVVYDRSLLVNQQQLPGAQDGAAVAYDWTGNASYYNNGCQALYSPLDASWLLPYSLCSEDSPIDLNQFVTGTPGGSWSGTGVSGGFFNPAGLSGTYQITYTVGSYPCADSVTNNINVYDSPSAAWSPPGPICSTDSPFDLNQFVTGVSGGTWSGIGVSGTFFHPDGLSGSVNVTYTAETPYCMSSEMHQINIIEAMSAQWTSPAGVCSNENDLLLELFITGNTGGIWEGAGIVNETTGLFSPSIAGLGNHLITYYFNDECGDSVSHHIIVYDSPQHSVFVSGESCSGSSDGWAFLEITGGTPPYSVLWSNSSTSDSVYHLAPGTYSFDITDVNLCSTSGQVSVLASATECIGPQIYVPNIFSPDGNGVNDILYVRSNDVQHIRFLIYNRWGQKVFESNSINKGWDGKVLGQNADTGVYRWMADVVFSNGLKKVFSGNVTLVR